MTSLRKLDQRLLDQRLLDQSLTGMSIGGMSARPRYNSQIMTKFIDTSQPIRNPLAPNILEKPAVRYNQYWDTDLQSYMYLQNFLKAVPG